MVCERYLLFAVSQSWNIYKIHSMKWMSLEFVQEYKKNDTILSIISRDTPNANMALEG